MIQYEVYVVFIGSVVAMQVTPGPNTLVVVSNGIYGGYKQALLYAAGVTAAGLVQVPIIVLGVGQIIRESALLYNVLCLAGALYLLYVGYGMIKSADRRQDSAELLEANRRKIDQAFWQGFVNNLLNPKVFVFMLAFIPLFVDRQGNIALQLFILAVTMKVCGLAVNSTYAVISATASRVLQFRPRFLCYQKIFSGGVVVLLGAMALGLNPVFGWDLQVAPASQHLRHQKLAADNAYQGARAQNPAPTSSTPAEVQ